MGLPHRADRRQLLRTGLGAGLIALHVRAGAGSTLDGGPDDEDLLDRALERLHERVSRNEHFLSNHVSMGAEALFTLGRADAIEAWVGEHLEPVAHDPDSTRAIDPERWKDALGQVERFQDWRAFFLAQLGEQDWRDVLRLWVPRFAPGAATAATHGLIRTAHATRAIGRRDVEIRRIELGTALAYWASHHETLPWNGVVEPATSVAIAIAGLQTRLPALAPPRGNIVAGLRALNETPSFAAVAGSIDTSDPSRVLSHMTEAFAWIYLRNPDRRIHLTHAVTASSAVRLVAPYLPDEAVETLVRFAWQAAAGLYVVYHDPRRRAPEATPAPGAGELIGRAVRSGDAHAIKLTEACLREQHVVAADVRLRAAADACAAL
jgi:hypothetical protein